MRAFIFAGPRANVLLLCRAASAIASLEAIIESASRIESAALHASPL